MIEYTQTTPVVTTLTGRFDDEAGLVLVESIQGHVSGADVHHIIDLRAVELVDARTIRTMIKINRLVSETGGSVALVIENPKALRYIKLTALHLVFAIHATPEAALAGSALAGSAPAGSTPAGSTPAGSTPAGSTPAGSTPA